jgi:hypothetical protein
MRFNRLAPMGRTDRRRQDFGPPALTRGGNMISKFVTVYPAALTCRTWGKDAARQ